MITTRPFLDVSSLSVITDLGQGTTLCFHAPSQRLYVKKRIRRECLSYYQIIRSINNPYLSKIVSISDEGDEVFAIREYLSGQSLASLLELKGTLPEQTALRYAIQLCHGLAELHQNGLVHRDINPNNIIITSDDNVKIIDYGIVRSFEQPKNTDTVILGTPGYAAPEQFGFSQSNQQTDIYSLGVLLQRMLSETPFPEAPLKGSLGKVIRRCLEIDAKKRYRDVTALRKALIKKAKKQPTEETDGAVDRLLQNIPGFRSGRPFFMIFSIFVYLILGLLTSSFYTDVPDGAYGYFYSTISWILIIVIPYFCFSNPFDFWNKIPFTAHSRRKSQRTFFYSIAIFSLISGLWFYGSMLPTT